MHKLSRRRLMAHAAKLGGGLFGLAALRCAGPVRTAPNPAYLHTPPAAEPGHAFLGWYPEGEMDRLVERVVAAITDLGWLGSGDSVFIKVACNSASEHPAVTSPRAVSAMVRFFQKRGAGRVLVGDQSGIEHVRLWSNGRRGSTREAMAANGLLQAAEQSGAVVHCFDDQGYDGYAQPADDFPNHWDGSLRLAEVLWQVDHVVNLTRLGSHALSGMTCGAKNAVGWLRDDSRLHLHQKGHRFFEQIAEINLFSPLRDKLRFTLSLGEAALLDVGPDFGSTVDFEGVMALGSRRLVDHDAVAAALLDWLDRDNASLFDIYNMYPEDVDFWNRWLVREFWGPEFLERGYTRLVAFEGGQGLATDRCLSHLAALQGYRPETISIERDGSGIPNELVAYLRAYDQGLFRL